MLNALNKRPTYVKQPFLTLSGYSHRDRARREYINFLEVIDSLVERKLIRESNLNEIINHLTVSESKAILKSINQKTSGKREDVIKRVLLNASDEDVKSIVDKNYFVVTDKGINVLKRYENVVWILENEDFIFNRSIKLYLGEFNSWKKFNQYYFMDNLDIDPVKTMVDYYKSKESRIVARIYQIENNEKKFFYYLIKQLAEDINFFLEASKERNISSIELSISMFHILILEYEGIDLDMAEKSLKIILKEIYLDTIKYKELLSFDKFERLVTLIFNDEKNLYNQLLETLDKEIKEVYILGHQDNNINIDSNNSDFCEKNQTVLSILDLVTKSDETKERLILELIEDLDLNIIKKIHKKLEDVLSQNN